MGVMRRSWIGVLLVALVALGTTLAAWTLVRERDYQRLMLRGDTALAADQTDVAIEAYSGALAVKGEAMIVYLKRGETYRRRGDLGNALRDLRTATRLDPSAARPAELLGDVNYGLERYSRAVESYRAAVELDDRNARALYKLGLALYRSGDPANAILPLQKAVALDERLGEGYYVLGLCQKDRHQNTDALHALEQAVKLAPALVAPRESLAEVYESLGRQREALVQLEALAALEPDRPGRQVAIGLAYARNGRTDAAILVLGRAAEKYPDNSLLYLALGRVWLDLAEPKHDRVALRKAIEALEPQARGTRPSSAALALFGRALLASGDTVRAAAVLEQAADVLPVDPATLLMLADASERLGRLPIVRTALERWTALTPDASPMRPVVFERLGDTCQRIGDQAEAVRAWRRAAEVSSTPALLVRLATTEYRMGDAAAARKTIARGLERNPGHPALVSLQRQFQ